MFILHMVGDLNLLKTIGIGRSLDQESTTYVQIKKSYNPNGVFICYTLDLKF